MTVDMPFRIMPMRKSHVSRVYRAESAVGSVRRKVATMYDLIVRGGRVIDPSQDIDAAMDIAVTGGKIALVGKDIPRDGAREEVDVRGKVVTPGLIDGHCHVSGSLLKLGVDPDVAGGRQSVTTVVDAGSTGEAVFGGFPRYVIPSSLTRVYCFLHLGSHGLSVMPELRDRDEINLEATAATIEAHRSVIKGVKLRLVGNLVAREGARVVETAKKVAGQFRMPIMVHIGDQQKQVASSVTRDVLGLMERGDVLSHMYTAQQGSALGPDGVVLPELAEAAKRGVVLDAAQGRLNLSFRVVKQMMEQGILPTTLSTDLTAPSLQGPVFGLTVTLSKFLALGFDLKQVVRMATVNPARVLGEDTRIGGLKPGMEADISVLELRSGRWRLEDSEQETVEADRLIVPFMAVKSGQVIRAEPLAQPRPVV